jgi:hypothetical protein
MQRMRRNTPERAPLPITGLTDEYGVARITHMSVGSVRRWRARGGGPPFVRPGGATSIRYRLEDIKSWLDSMPRIGGGAPNKEEGCTKNGDK